MKPRNDEEYAPSPSSQSSAVRAIRNSVGISLTLAVPNRNLEDPNYLQPTLRNRKLFRSSCPNYDGEHDSSQNLNQAAVDILVQHNINRIVSFNQVAYNADEMDRLSKANIIYRHLPVVDFTAATIDQLRLAIAFVREGSPANTLIHCGFGWGRSGTGVSAVQMFATWGELPNDVWKIKGTNHVEEQVQVDVLEELQTRYKRGA